jgi:hypothetical protein
VAFDAELVLQRSDDRLHPLPQPVREVPGANENYRVRIGQTRFLVAADR